MDWSKIFNGESMTMEQFAEKVKDLKLVDLKTGEYVAKAKYDADIKKRDDDLTTARETIQNLEKNAGDTKALQDEIQKYKDAEAERAKAEEAAKTEKEQRDRFAAARGDKEFAHELIEKGIFQEFAKAIGDPANVGKGDAELFASLTKDKDGIFKSQRPPANMGGFNGRHKGMTKEQIMGIKDTAERQEAMAENHELFGL